MHQQINLYQPIFREERKLFSLDTVAIGLCIVAMALLAIWAVGKHNVDKLALAVDQLKQQQAVQQKLAESAGSLFDGRGNVAELQSSVQLMSAQLAEKNKALDTLHSGVAGEPRGFAPRMAALARQHADGVWLEEVFLGAGPNGLMLRGRCNDAELLPKYLQLLTGEPELAGARFDELVLDRRKYHELTTPSDGEKATDADTRTVRFSISSKAALVQIPEYRQATESHK